MPCPRGGRLTITARNDLVDEVYAGMNSSAKPGPYVSIAVTDTGTGIPPEIRDKIFDPFFTTKEIGKGTGLGLSTTLSIIKGHGGFINLYSEPGKGSTFKIHLPACLDPAAVVSETQTSQPLRGNGEMLLFVDDEEGLRSVAKKILESFGYRVLLAVNGAEALSVYVLHRTQIRAVITDMAMPIMDGPACVAALRSLDPGMPIMGSSGMADREALSKARENGLRQFLAKPYTAEALLKAIKQLLSGDGT